MEIPEGEERETHEAFGVMTAFSKIKHKTQTTDPRSSEENKK